MELVTSLQFLDDSVCVSLRTNAFEKGMNVSYVSPPLRSYG